MGRWPWNGWRGKMSGRDAIFDTRSTIERNASVNFRSTVGAKKRKRLISSKDIASTVDRALDKWWTLLTGRAWPNFSRKLEITTLTYFTSSRSSSCRNTCGKTYRNIPSWNRISTPRFHVFTGNANSHNSRSWPTYVSGLYSVWSSETSTYRRNWVVVSPRCSLCSRTSAWPGTISDPTCVGTPKSMTSPISHDPSRHAAPHVLSRTRTHCHACVPGNWVRGILRSTVCQATHAAVLLWLHRQEPRTSSVPVLRDGHR